MINKANAIINQNHNIMAGKFLWILDNGHGNSTAGKRSPILFNRDIVKRLIEKLVSVNLNYHNLVPESSGDIPLSTRVSRANELKTSLMKIYVSIHSNAQSNDWGTASGVETFCYSKNSKSERLAKCFQSNLITTLGWKDRGVKTEPFYVLKHTRMPAILTENGFYSNLEECKMLLDNNWRDKIAEAHFIAIKEIEKKGLNF